MDKLQIISFNCQSVRSNLEIIQNLTTECDIICLQETLIDENNFDILGQIDSSFMMNTSLRLDSLDVFQGVQAVG